MTANYVPKRELKSNIFLIYDLYIEIINSPKSNDLSAQAYLHPRRMINTPHSATSKTSPEIIGLAVMLYVRLPLSLRDIEEPLYEYG